MSARGGHYPASSTTQSWNLAATDFCVIPQKPAVFSRKDISVN